MGDTRVVNLHAEPYDVYIGRMGKGRDGYFGNPHTVDRICRVCQCVHKQGEAVEAFRKTFIRRMNTEMEYFKAVEQLRGKVLGCFCKPKPCHGDIYVEYLEGRLPMVVPLWNAKEQ